MRDIEGIRELSDDDRTLSDKQTRQAAVFITIYTILFSPIMAETTKSLERFWMNVEDD